MDTRNLIKLWAGPASSTLAVLLASTLAFAACATPASQPTATTQAKSAQTKQAAEPTAAASKPAPSAAQNAPTAETKLEKINLAYSATDPGNMPLWIAQDAGIFKKNGLDSELSFVESGTTLVSAMIAGDIPIAGVAGSAVVQAITSGGELAIIASTGSGFPYKVITTASIKTPEDLKGKRMGVSKFGSASDFSLRQALKAMKLDPSKDVQLLEVGTDATRVAALQGGSIDGTVLNPPGSTLLLKAGFNALMDMSTILDLYYQHGTYTINKAFLKNNRPLAQRFIKAIVEAIHFERTNKEETKKILAKRALLDDPDGLEEAYQLYNGPNSRLLEAAPYPSEKGLEVVLQEVLQGKPEAKSLTVKDLIDTSLVKELDDSGYIKSLY